MAAPRALDIEPHQVAVDFYGDAGGFNWHGRLLLVKLNDDGRWAGVTPTLEVQSINLGDHRVVPLPRGSLIPDQVVYEGYYGFNADDVTDEVLQDLRVRAIQLSVVLGAAPSAPTTAISRWYVSDPAWEEFAQEVPGHLIGTPAKVVVRGSTGIVQLEEGGRHIGWVAMERVLPSDLAA